MNTEEIKPKAKLPLEQEVGIAYVAGKTIDGIIHGDWTLTEKLRLMTFVRLLHELKPSPAELRYLSKVLAEIASEFERK